MIHKIINCLSISGIAGCALSLFLVPNIRENAAGVLIYAVVALLAGIGQLYTFETDNGPLFKRKGARKVAPFQTRKFKNINLKELYHQTEGK